ncbi:peptidase M23 [Saccharobesus litoralis]|uniref:Peptidase M23 n=1 Tax=Saccharobesus litoralis TaxID=2172099 RepID=A0A2S0VNR1_9ALTE|nr:peptidoglycan DD-metalloendopeptidase family protein [Saccharobesus litoralis]AWB65822.1 peptidase M23 [Saccharobesus litoralis]
MLHIWHQFPRTHQISIGAITGIILLASFFPSDDASASRHTDDDSGIEINNLGSLRPGERIALPLDLDLTENPAISTLAAENKPSAAYIAPSLVSQQTIANNNSQPVSPQTLVEQEQRVVTADVKKNDSLAKIFERHKIPAKTLLEVSKNNTAKQIIKQLKPGDEIIITFDNNNELAELAYAESAIDTLIVTATETGFKGRKLTKQVETSEAFSFASISSSFWNAGVDAGLTETQIMNLANIFGWDIDFALDIRKDDSFNVVFEKRYVDGEYIGPGEILAAEFINQNQSYAAVLHSDGNYYTPEGRSMRKAFLRAPVNFKYISSSFNPRRLHPVTGKVRPHRGIDYAARTGTPVVAAGDGKVIRSGYSKLNGNYVFIQHGEKYTTKYLHLHRRYVKTGAKVRQNQKIGTVGATGRVTGPHLHYEFLVDGVHRNPKTVKLPKAVPIDKNEKANFLAQSKKMTALLAQNKRILLAQTN